MQTTLVCKYKPTFRCLFLQSRADKTINYAYLGFLLCFTKVGQIQLLCHHHLHHLHHHHLHHQHLHHQHHHLLRVQRTRWVSTGSVICCVWLEIYSPAFSPHRTACTTSSDSPPCFVSNGDHRHRHHHHHHHHHLHHHHHHRCYYDRDLGSVVIISIFLLSQPTSVNVSGGA